MLIILLIHIQLYLLFHLGEIVVFQVFNAFEENVYFNLDQLHLQIDNPLNPESELLLMGAVGYHGVSGLQAGCQPNSNSANGHYTTFVYRRGDTSWMELDDLRNNSIFRIKKHKIVPRLLMYIKNNKM